MEEYIPLEYPKWVDGVVVQNAVEEQAPRGTVAKPTSSACAAERVRLPSPASIRTRRTRERRREGGLSFRCDISFAQRETLAKAGRPRITAGGKTDRRRGRSV